MAAQMSCSRVVARSRRGAATLFASPPLRRLTELSVTEHACVYASHKHPCMSKKVIFNQVALARASRIGPLPLPPGISITIKDPVRSPRQRRRLFICLGGAVW